MKRNFQIMAGVILIVVGLGSSLIFQNVYAQTPDQKQSNSDEAASLVANLQTVQFDTQPDQAIYRLEPQPQNGTTETENKEPMRTVNVSGSGQVNARPDLAIVRLGVQTEAETANEALSENSTRMQALIDTLEAAGIPAEDIQTQTIQLQPRYGEQPSAQGTSPQLVGYLAINTVEVRTGDLDNLGSVLDAAIEAGGNTIDGIRFEVSNPAEQLAQAREAAMDDARQKAEQLAALADAALGDVLTINESGAVPRPIVRESLALSAAAVPVEPGTQAIQVDVQVTWLLR